MAINQITKVKMPDGTEVALTDWSARPIYSTADFLTGFVDEEVRVFTYTASERVSSTQNLPVAARRTATLADTNIASASEMAAVEEYLVYEIKVEMYQFVLNTQTTAFAITAAGLPIPQGPIMSFFHSQIIGELEVSDKAFPQAGIGWFAQGFGPVLAITDNAAGVRTYANNGLQTHEASYNMPIPCHIGGTEDFAFIFHNPRGAAVTFPDEAGGSLANSILMCRTYLNGLHKRPTA